MSHKQQLKELADKLKQIATERNDDFLHDIWNDLNEDADSLSDDDSGSNPGDKVPPPPPPPPHS